MKTILREPLLHFLAVGALLFLVAGGTGGAGTGSGRIAIQAGQVESLAAGFARTWQRPPTAAELESLVDDAVREEIATREASAMGLDRGDTAIRRRLRQKFELLAEDAAEAAAPSDAELTAYIQKHADAYRVEPRVGLPPLAEVRPRAEREVLAARKKAKLDALYEPLLRKYRVTVAPPKAAPAGGAPR